MKIKQTKHTLSGYVSSAFSRPLSICFSLSRRINVSYLIQHGRRAFCCDRQCAKKQQQNKKESVSYVFCFRTPRTKDSRELVAPLTI